MKWIMQPGSFAKIASTVVAILLLATVTWLRNQPRPTPVGSARSAVRSQPAGRFDLGHDEQLGGHTLKRHVSRTDEQLRERLAQEHEISAASTYIDRVAAEETVAAVLAQEHDRVEAWLNRSDVRPNLDLQFHGHQPIVRSLRRGDQPPHACSPAAVVARWGGGPPAGAHREQVEGVARRQVPAVGRQSRAALRPTDSQ